MGEGHRIGPAARACLRADALDPALGPRVRRHAGPVSLMEEYGVTAEKITVIPPGVDTGRWLRADSSAPPVEPPVRILFVGGNVRRKGGDLLREVFTELRRVARCRTLR